MANEFHYSRFYDEFVLEVMEHSGGYVTELKVQMHIKNLHNKKNQSFKNNFQGDTRSFSGSLSIMMNSESAIEVTAIEVTAIEAATIKVAIIIEVAVFCRRRPPSAPTVVRQSFSTFISEIICTAFSTDETF